jgi:hypothetical protein
MKIVFERPPIWDKAIAQFKFHPSRQIVFAYGDTLYNPNQAGVSPDLMTHEEVHGVQQRHHGGPEAWWDMYLADPKFREAQELEAYGAQARYLKQLMGNKKKLALRLDKLAQDMSSEMYGNVIDYPLAVQMIERLSRHDIFKVYAELGVPQ